ncbi:MAG: GNAT family N-acetyltransferase [Anaerolineaceae bacterium]|nr:GNAT family N-acetyltransferase [Anaerolineaceae bacterium]
MEIRQVNDGELVAAARLVYPGLPEASRQARKAIERAPQRLGIDFRRQIVALDDGSVRGSCLYILSPGRSATVLQPELDRRCPLPDHRAAFAIREMILLAGRACREAGALLVQTLLDDSPEQPSGKLFIEAGFRHLALLEYLEMPVGGLQPHQAEAWTWETFRSGGEKDFTQVIERTYEGSLDCPQLDRLRSAADALAGHRSSGHFTPQGWLLARRDGEAAGLVLVNRAVGRSACSLVYMGVVPEHRGTGLGRALVGQAIGKTSELGGDVLTVAVDSRNTPARKLYEEVGMRRVGSRHVYYLPRQER